jgi:hypothetical protein
MNLLTVFYFWAIFALLDPDPDPNCESGSGNGSWDPIEQIRIHTTGEGTELGIEKERKSGKEKKRKNERERGREEK